MIQIVKSSRMKRLAMGRSREKKDTLKGILEFWGNAQIVVKDAGR